MKKFDQMSKLAEESTTNVGAQIHETDSNISASGDAERVNTSLLKLQDKSYLRNKKETLEQYVKQFIDDSIKKGSVKEKEITLFMDTNIPLSYVNLLSELNNLDQMYKLAIGDDKLNGSQAAKDFGLLLKCYHSQLDLLRTLDKMYYQELEASTHDRPILHNLRKDFLHNWKNATDIKNPKQKNKELNQLFLDFQHNCESAASQVKDEVTGAFIKNTLLIVSAILTLGVSLLIYAFENRMAIAENNSFFYKNSELSRPLVNEACSAAEDTEKYFNLGYV